ncbi:cation:proton antiporter regulatory subunit [Halalkalicoccus salilacus]|uniref:cation:proton antiporter regulatory subunit n=1 Tax=Halalkalicoccus salilacus TaxID=3117459 RepID=UPI00300E7BAB
MVSSLLLENEGVLTLETQFELIRTTAPEMVGRSLGEVDVRARTGCTVVAAERGDQLLTDLGPEFTSREGDTLLVAGSDETITNSLLSPDDVSAVVIGYLLYLTKYTSHSERGEEARKESSQQRSGSQYRSLLKRTGRRHIEKQQLVIHMLR